LASGLLVDHITKACESLLSNLSKPATTKGPSRTPISG
jgi:hypothetical protein